MDIADVTIHVDENINHDQRVGIIDSMIAHGGVTDVISSDSKPHIMVVKYDPSKVSSHDLLQIVRDSGVHAELIGL